MAAVCCGFKRKAGQSVFAAAGSVVSVREGVGCGVWVETAVAGDVFVGSASSRVVAVGFAVGGTVWVSSC